jgi:hypothetical protein
MSLQGWQETLITSQADGSTLTAAAAATALPAAAKYTLPANFFAIGKQLLIKASGRLSIANPTPGTARFDVRFGATVVADSQAMLLDTAAAHNNEAFYIEMLLTCRVIGTSANLHQGGFFASYGLKNVGTMPVGGLVAALPWSGTAPVVGSNFDSTATQVIDFFFTQTVATGSMTLHQFGLYSLN